MALKIQITATPLKYFKKLDQSTQERIRKKLEDIADSPFDARLSYPLTANDKRATRVGSYRILFHVDQEILEVADIGPRGQVYRRI